MSVGGHVEQVNVIEFHGDAIITQRVVQRQGRKTKDEVTSDDPTNA